MKKEQKRKAEGGVRLLEQIHTQLRRVLDAKSEEAALELLTQCQSTAINLGEMIEDTEGQDFVTVTLAEQYCELVYQIYQSVRQDPGAVSGGQAYNSLAKQLIRIKNSICQDIPVRSEVVFLPYKASMWDSLESIWRAADADPGCDTYVVPIPYYDRGADGKPGLMHYEGREYPADVPVTDYTTYDFSSRHPDMIFIHYPYDDCNLVTTIPTFFYAKNLKQFTDRLVYVPYFILSETDLESEQALDGLETYCNVPGVVYADRVIVQSEAMRTAYIKVLTKAFGESTRSYWEKKIAGLGSPKLDKVSAVRRDQLQLPEAWRKIIYKPDGSRKKVVLYNIGLSPMLRYEEKMLAKIRAVLETFKENQKEIALLWRPHPLIQATMVSLRPGLLGAYQGLVEQYKEEGWGIYDDTADLDRAIAIADAYYGDGSSVVQLCQSVGMPVMIQNVEV